MKLFEEFEGHTFYATQVVFQAPDGFASSASLVSACGFDSLNPIRSPSSWTPCRAESQAPAPPTPEQVSR